MFELSSVARPYARAAFEFAVAQQALQQWQSMLGFAAQVSSDAQMVELLTNPVTVVAGAAILQSICQPALNHHGQNFLRIMAQNNRLTALPAVFKQFNWLHQAMARCAEAVVISAHPLSTTQQDNLTTALAKRLACNVTLQCRVDQTLLAGLVIRVGDLVIDGSVRGRLNRLASQLHA